MIFRYIWRRNKNNRFAQQPFQLGFPAHDLIFGFLGSIMFILGFIAVVVVGATKLYDMYCGNPYRLVTESPYFYLALTTMILGTQLFLAGFIGELIARNSPERNNYQIEKEIE